MSTENEKAKKLKEIQDRLAEIQGKTVSNTSNTQSEKKDVEKKPENEPAEIEKKIIQSAPKKTTTEKVKDKTKLPIAELIKEDKKQEESHKKWEENKIKASDQDKNKDISNLDQKSKSKPEAVNRNRSNKILSIISIIITLGVTSYIIYTYFLSGETNEVIEAQVPVPAEKEDLPDKENVALEEELIEDTEMEEEILKPIKSEETSESSTKRVNAKRNERKEQIAEQTKKKATSVSSIEKTSVPGDFIISYSSNGSSSAAGKNVINLRSRGFNANYYYMRDKEPSGPDLYKVYLGPYASESEAFPDFKKIIKINDKAFILKMK